MRSGEDKENISLREMAENNKYYSEFLGKLDAIMELYKEKNRETPKLFNKINDVIRRHKGNDYETNRAAMKELYQLYSRQDETLTLNPIKGAKKAFKSMGAGISIHGHDISDDLYKAFAQIDISKKTIFKNASLSILNTALDSLVNKPSLKK